MPELGYYYDPVLGRINSPNEEPIIPGYPNSNPYYNSNPFAIGVPGSSNTNYASNVASNQAIQDYYTNTYANSPSVNYTDPNIAAFYQQLANNRSNPTSTAGQSFVTPYQQDPSAMIAAALQEIQGILGRGPTGFSGSIGQYIQSAFGQGVAGNAQVQQAVRNAENTFTQLRNAGIEVLPGGSGAPLGSTNRIPTASYNPSTGSYSWFPGMSPGDLSAGGNLMPGYTPNTGALGALGLGGSGGGGGVPPPGGGTPPPPLPQLTQQLQGYLSSIDSFIRTLPQFQGGQITDEVRRQFGFPTATELQMNLQYRQNNPNSSPGGILGSTNGTPYVPTGNAPTGFNWTWSDPDQQGPNPGNWALTLAGAPNSFSDYQNLINTLSNPAYGNKFFSIPQNLQALQFMFSGAPLNEQQFNTLAPMYGNSSQAQYNASLNNALASLLPTNLRSPTASQAQSPAFLMQLQGAFDALRQSMGLPSWALLQQPRGTPNQSWFGYDPAGLNLQNAPYLPTVAPTAGFLYQWNPNAVANGVGAWTQSFNGQAPTNQAGINSLLNSLNLNPSAIYTGLPAGFNRTVGANGPSWSYAAPSSSNTNSNIFGGGGSVVDTGVNSTPFDFSGLLASIFGGSGSGSGGTQSVSSTLNTNTNNNTGPWTYNNLTNRPGAQNPTQNLWG